VTKENEKNRKKSEIFKKKVFTKTEKYDKSGFRQLRGKKMAGNVARQQIQPFYVISKRS